MERMFDGDSFKDEITTKEEAEQCVDYLASNEMNFRSQLVGEGLSYDEVQSEIGAVWKNLIAACKRVGFSNTIVEAKSEEYD